MKKFFVYYKEDCDSHGLKSFDKDYEALAFIKSRIAAEPLDERSIKNYIVIHGDMLVLEEIRFAVEIGIDWSRKHEANIDE